METQNTVQNEQSKELAIAVADALPDVLTAPDTTTEAPELTEAQKAEAAAVAKVMEGLKVITQDLREIVANATKTREAMARALAHGYRLAGPGNVKQFDKIMSDCEAAVLAEHKVAKWAELGQEARSYLTYKSHFRKYIEVLKASYPEGVDPITLRRQVTDWYLNQKDKAKSGSAEGKGEGAKSAPDGEKPSAGLAQAEVITDKGKKEQVNFPAPVIAQMVRLSKAVGYAITCGVPGEKVCEVLKFATDELDELTPDPTDKAK